MLEFLLILGLFIFSSGCFTKVMYQAIRQGAVFGAWQKVLMRLHAKGWDNTRQFLGDCYHCFSHLWSIVWFVLYFIFNKYFFEVSYGWWYILIYVMFVAISINMAEIISGIINRLNNEKYEDLIKRIEDLEHEKEKR